MTAREPNFCLTIPNARRLPKIRKTPACAALACPRNEHHWRRSDRRLIDSENRRAWASPTAVNGSGYRAVRAFPVSRMNGRYLGVKCQETAATGPFPRVAYFLNFDTQGAGDVKFRTAGSQMRCGHHR